MFIRILHIKVNIPSGQWKDCVLTGTSDIATCCPPRYCVHPLHGTQ